MTLSNIYGAARVLIDADYQRIGAHLIQPFNVEQVQPASYDVMLSDQILIPKSPDKPIGLFSKFERIDLRTSVPESHMKPWVMKEDGWLMRPGECVLAATVEQVRCPSDMICSVDGRSTLGRCFLAIHATAGFIDPGYCGAITLEIMNHGPWEFRLYPGLRIGQLRFHWLGVEVDRPYGSPGLGSHYQGSTSVRAAEPIGK